MAFVGARPVEGMPVMVVAVADRAERSEMITRAGGRVIGPVQAVLGTLAISEDPDFFSRLREQGPVFIANGIILSEICGGKG